MPEVPSEHPNQTLLARLPAVATILLQPEVERLGRTAPIALITRCAQLAVEEVRKSIQTAQITLPEDIPDATQLGKRTVQLVHSKLAPTLIHAINGAGVILHTGLGRAPLPPAARKALIEATERYSLLALDRETGKRGDRFMHVEDTLIQLTGAEAALVVNNNAAAVMLVLTAFAAGKEAIVSRGELVEIGGSFRIPDVMARSGAKMVEVGTTNKTHLRDYIEAFASETTVILKVHPSNYRITGFTSDVALKPLSLLAHERGAILIYDQGCGAMIDLRRWGLPTEPTVSEAITAGADLVTFSGDKLIGGPQCGIIVGCKELVGRVKKHPLMRALRPDKLTLAALAGTLKLFLDPDRLPVTHPVYAMLAESLSSVSRRSQAIARAIRQTGIGKLGVEIVSGTTEFGSGALPTQGIPTRLVAVTPTDMSTQTLAGRLRRATPPLFTRIENDRLLIDARTVTREEVRLIERVFKQVLAGS